MQNAKRSKATIDRQSPAWLRRKPSSNPLHRVAQAAAGPVQQWAHASNDQRRSNNTNLTLCEWSRMCPDERCSKGTLWHNQSVWFASVQHLELAEHAYMRAFSRSQQSLPESFWRRSPFDCKRRLISQSRRFLLAVATDRRLETLAINTIRMLSIDAVQKANSGHPGLPMGAAAMGYVVWHDYLKHNPRDPHWFDRDRFVLSAGHGSMLLYSLLYLTGYDLPLDQIKNFRQLGSETPGHPERGDTPGVEITTGPLGQGLANAVGMAIAEAQLAARYNRPEYAVIDHATYAIVSDGDLMEGVASEAASLAGHLRLGKLTCLYDDNRVTLAAGTDITFSEDRAARFQAYGWHTVMVTDGNDLAAID